MADTSKQPDWFIFSTDNTGWSVFMVLPQFFQENSVIFPHIKTPYFPQIHFFLIINFRRSIVENTNGVK